MEINSREARKRFSELLDLASRGEKVVVTRRGKPSVRLVAEEVLGSSRPLPNISEFRASIRVRGALSDTVREEREEARY